MLRGGEYEYSCNISARFCGADGRKLLGMISPFILGGGNGEINSLTSDVTWFFYNIHCG